MKLRLTAFSISSIDMKMEMMFLRNKKPAMPSANNTALRIRYQARGGPLILQLLSREHDGADDRDENQDGSNFKRQQILGEQRAADVLGGAALEGAEMHHRGRRI